MYWGRKETKKINSFFFFLQSAHLHLGNFFFLHLTYIYAETSGFNTDFLTYSCEVVNPYKSKIVCLATGKSKNR